MRVIAVDKRELQKRFANPADFKLLFEVSILLIYVTIAAIVGFVASFLGSWVFFALLLPAIASIGMLQYALAQAAHEAAHHHLSRRSPVSLLNSVLLFYALGMTPDYQRLHMRHHTAFGNAEVDPDYPVYMCFPKSQSAFIAFVAKSLSGYSALTRFFQLNAGSPKQAVPEGHKVELARIALTQIGLLALFWIGTGSPLLYGILWLAPIIVVVKTMVDVRLLAEHGGETTPALRTFLKSDVVTWLFGAYGFQNHAEHHVLMTVQYRELPQLTDYILTHGADGPNAVNIEYLEGNHLGFLWEKFKLLPWK